MGRGYALVLLLFGQVNVFPRPDAGAILRRAHAALAPGGVLVLEPQAPEAVRAAGNRGATWTSARTGLFAAGPHLLLDEGFWDAPTRTATERLARRSPRHGPRRALLDVHLGALARGARPYVATAAAAAAVQSHRAGLGKRPEPAARRDGLVAVLARLQRVLSDRLLAAQPLGLGRELVILTPVTLAALTAARRACSGRRTTIPIDPRKPQPIPCAAGFDAARLGYVSASGRRTACSGRWR